MSVQFVTVSEFLKEMETLQESLCGHTETIDIQFYHYSPEGSSTVCYHAATLRCEAHDKISEKVFRHLQSNYTPYMEVKRTVRVRDKYLSKIYILKPIADFHVGSETVRDLFSYMRNKWKDNPTLFFINSESKESFSSAYVFGTKNVDSISQIDNDNFPEKFIYANHLSMIRVLLTSKQARELDFINVAFDRSFLGNEQQSIGALKKGLRPEGSYLRLIHNHINDTYAQNTYLEVGLCVKSNQGSIPKYRVYSAEGLRSVVNALGANSPYIVVRKITVDHATCTPSEWKMYSKTYGNYGNGVEADLSKVFTLLTSMILFGKTIKVSYTNSQGAMVTKTFSRERPSEYSQIFVYIYWHWVLGSKSDNGKYPIVLDRDGIPYVCEADTTTSEYIVDPRVSDLSVSVYTGDHSQSTMKFNIITSKNVIHPSNTLATLIETATGYNETLDNAIDEFSKFTTTPRGKAALV